jgi:hypothetical protein
MVGVLGGRVHMALALEIKQSSIRFQYPPDECSAPA